MTMESPFITISFAVIITSRILPVKSVIQVEIACAGQAFPNNAAALGFLGPAYEKAVEDVNKIYVGVLNLTITFLAGADDIRSCPPMRDVSIYKMAEWYYTKRIYSDGIGALLTPGCLEVGDSHELTANWNMTYFNTAGGEKSPYKLPAPPIITTAFISLPDISAALVKLLFFYNWTTVYMVVDHDGPPIYFYLALEIYKLREASNYRLNVFTHDISTKDGSVSYQSVLEQFSAVSRVLLFLGHAKQLRKLLVGCELANFVNLQGTKPKLEFNFSSTKKPEVEANNIEAVRKDMTAGDYVYIGQQASEYPLYGRFSWLTGDDDDEVVQHAYRSLLLVHPFDMVWNFSEEITDLLAEVRQKGIRKYYYSYTPDQQPPREILTAYSTIGFIGQVANRTLASAGQSGLFNANHFAQGFLNTTYHDKFSEIVIDASGTRRIALVVSYFTGEITVDPTNQLSAEKKPFLAQSKEDNFEFHVISNLSTIWPGGTWPPRNEPLCGYTNQKISCHKTAGITELLAVLVAVCAALVALVSIVLRRLLWHFRLHDFWWKMDSTRFAILVKPVPSSLLSKANTLHLESAVKYRRFSEYASVA